MSTFSKTYLKILGFLAAITTFILILGIINFFVDSKKSLFSFYAGDKNSQNKIALLRINGPIISEPMNFFNFGTLSETKAIYPSLVNNYLNELKDIQISGLIVSINSPGGSVSASNEIYNQFKDFKNNQNIPMYFHSTEMLASGAYWISLSGDKILANYGTLIGSIGVKGPDWIYYNNPNLLSNGLLSKSIESKNGIKMFSSLAGKSKDLLNPFRAPSAEEKKQLQNMVNNIYVKFVNLVSSNRKIEKEIIISEIGAMIYESNKAKKINLINDVKTLNETIELIKNELEISKLKIITNSKQKSFNLNFMNSKLNINNDSYIFNIFCNNIKNELSVAVTNSYFNNC